MRPVLLMAEASADLEAARDFYDERERGIGEYCVDSLLADIESLSLYHGIHSLQFGCHRMLGTRFPFGIYYLKFTKPAKDLISFIATQLWELRKDIGFTHGKNLTPRSTDGKQCYSGHKKAANRIT